MNKSEAYDAICDALDTNCLSATLAQRESAARAIMQLFFSPRTRPREVVAPSGETYRVVGDKVCLGVTRTMCGDKDWEPITIVPTKDCATVADLQANPDEPVPDVVPEVRGYLVLNADGTQESSHIPANNGAMNAAYDAARRIPGSVIKQLIDGVEIVP